MGVQFKGKPQDAHYFTNNPKFWHQNANINNHIQASKVSLHYIYNLNHIHLHMGANMVKYTIPITLNRFKLQVIQNYMNFEFL